MSNLAYPIALLGLFCLMLVVGFSDNNRLAAWRGNKSWREHYVDQICESASGTTLFFFDKNLFSGPPGLLNLFFNTVKSISPNSPGGYRTLLFARYIMNFEFFIVLYLVHKSISKELNEDMNVYLCLFLFVAFFTIIRSVVVDFIKYYSITAVSGASLIHISRTSYLKTDIEKINIHEIKRIAICNRYICLPQHAYSIEIHTNSCHIHNIRLSHSIESWVHFAAQYELPLSFK